MILETEADFEIVAEGAEVAEGVKVSQKLNPKVILMDLRMPGMDVITAIQHLSQDQPEAAVIILTTYNEDELMFEGLKAGARGYLLKDTERTPLFNSIRAAARGETLLSPEIMERVLSQVDKLKKPRKDLEKNFLTEREQEVLSGVAEGKTSKEAARPNSLNDPIMYW